MLFFFFYHLFPNFYCLIPISLINSYLQKIEKNIFAFLHVNRNKNITFVPQKTF